MKAKGSGFSTKERKASWKRGKWDPPPMDSYAARHLPNGKLTVYGVRMLLKEKIAETKNRKDEERDLPQPG